MQYDRKISISVANTRYGPWQTQESNLSEFYARLSQPSRGQEDRKTYLAMPKREQDRLKDVGGFVAGVLKDGLRQSGHVISRCMITLDIDNLEPGGAARIIKVCDSLGCGYAIYSTRKHAPESPRLRVILPLAQDLSADEYEPATRKAASFIDPTMQAFDRTTFQDVRLMYWPSVCAGAEYVFQYADRPFTDGKALLSLFDWQNVVSWPRCPDEDANERRTASKQQDPTEKDGIVGAFCRVYDVPAAIEKFLPGVYEETASDDRLTYTQGSTSGGAVLYENGKFLYSHHATDPAGGQLCNAFDLVRLHLFKDQDSDIKPGTPVVKMPSWAAMCKFAESDPEVHAQKVNDRAEQIKRDFAPMIENAVNNQPAASVSAPPAPQESVSDDTGEITPYAPKNVSCGSVDDVMKRLAEMLEDGQNKITSGLVEAAMSAMGIVIGRNEITGRVQVQGLPRQYSAEEAENTLPVVLSDFLRANSVNAAPETVRAYIAPIADRNRFNPVQEWLRNSAWDGFSRWPMIYEILGITEAGQEKYRTYVHKWFLQSVAMAFNSSVDPRSADGALVLQGPQGCGKTLFFRRMAAYRDWFAEGVSINFDKTDTLIRATGAWITELGELDSTLKREQSALKAFITAERDDIRRPYGFASVNRLRRTSFCGTVNPEDFLRDETGSRRWWVVPVGRIDVERLIYLDQETVHQIWLQAYSEWLCSKNSYRLTSSEREELEHDNSTYEARVLWVDELEDLMDFDLPNDRRVEVSAAWLAQNILRNGAKAVAVGKALSVIAKTQPAVEYVRTSTKRVWRIPLKAQTILAFGLGNRVVG